MDGQSGAGLLDKVDRLRSVGEHRSVKENRRWASSGSGCRCGELLLLVIELAYLVVVIQPDAAYQQAEAQQ